MLTEKYGERRIAIAITMSGELIEVFVSPKGREVAGNTFSIVLTDPRTGLLCMLTYGSSWQTPPPST